MRIKRLFTALWCGLLLTLPTRNLAAQPRETLGIQADRAASFIEKYLAARHPVDVVVSPNGSFAAYVVKTHSSRESTDVADSRGRLRIWVIDLKTTELFAVGREYESSYAPSWSPDSARIAFLGKREGRLQLCVHDISRGATLVLTGARISTAEGRAQWMPDGRHIVIAIEREIERWGLVGFSRSQILGSIDLRTRVYGSGEESPQDNSVVRKLTAASLPSRNSAFVRIDAQTGTVSKIEPEEIQVTDVSVAPGGAVCAIAGAAIMPRAEQYIYIIDAMDGTLLAKSAGGVLWSPSEPGTTGGALIRSVRWHPKGNCIAYLTQQGLHVLERLETGEWRSRTLVAGRFTPRLFAFARNGSFVVVGNRAETALNDPLNDLPNIESVTIAPISGDSSRRLKFPDGVRGNQLMLANDSVLWQPSLDHFDIIATDHRRGERCVTRIECHSGSIEVSNYGRYTVHATSAPADHSFLVAISESFTRPANLYSCSGSFGFSDRLTVVEPLMMDMEVGSIVTFTPDVGGRGQQTLSLRTEVILPSGTGHGSFPTIVHVYGGSDLTSQNMLFGGGRVAAIPSLVFTLHGYAVMHTYVPMNIEGSKDEPLISLVQTLESQVKYISEEGLVDNNRIGVIGESYGGYCVAAVLAESNAFSVGVAISGVYDLGSVFALIDRFGNLPYVRWSMTGQGMMGVDLWADPSRYRRNSPYYQSDAIVSPLLLIHGESDERCPVVESEKLFGALQYRRRTAQLAVYPGEGHGMESWSNKNLTDATTRILEFLNRYMK